ncbi:3'-5' exonuclease family protein [Paraburkholderia domus]|uniref:3'-5' exoribonuclease n=1 Tax=Paraburkholderia domus TaxID=2793075 RepID=UPI001B0940AB|nr:3'-5' exoribonuclease [Paraburkholderia domus]CAE6697396.1 3'-5' exoribonuclease [Paraburkholderia domus]
MRDPWKPRYFLDTEFTDFIDCQLISLAIVGEDGREFYGEVTDFKFKACSEFVRAAVLPQLGQFAGRAMSFAQLRSELLAWLYRIPLKPRPVLCYDYQGDFDLLGDMIDGPLPAGWKYEHIGGQIDVNRQEAYFREHGGRHHALHDARANAFAFL